MTKFSGRIIAIIIMITVVTFLFSSAVGYALDSSIENRFVGTPIAETTFANLSSAEPGSVMFPGSVIEVSEEFISMRVNFTESELCNHTDASSSALLFMSQFAYLTQLNFTLDEGWTRLESGKWTLRFYSPSADVYVGVNAFTCTVLRFAVRWVGPSPYVREVDSSILSISEVELAAAQFLLQNNISLSIHSQYIPAVLKHDIQYLTHNVFAIRFFESINNTLIEGNVISIILDILTGNVVDFSYQWVYVEGIPTEDIIDNTSGINYALAYIEQESNSGNTRVAYSILLFKDFGSVELMSYSLCRAIYTDNSEFGVVYVNAKSGEIISTLQTGLISEFIENTRLDLLSLIMPVSLTMIFAIAAFAITNHLVKEEMPVIKNSR